MKLTEEERAELDILQRKTAKIDRIMPAEEIKRRKYLIDKSYQNMCSNPFNFSGLAGCIFPCVRKK